MLLRHACESLAAFGEGIEAGRVGLDPATEDRVLAADPSRAFRDRAGQLLDAWTGPSDRLAAFFGRSPVLLAGALRRPDWPVAAQPHLYSVIDDLSGFGLGQSAPAVGSPGQRFGDHDQQQLVDSQADVGDVQRAAFCLLADIPA